MNTGSETVNTGKTAPSGISDAYEGANRCIQCAYCLPVCPTYQSMGREAQSPRGRIHLVKAAAEGKIDIIDDMTGPLELCLGCRACETACPVGVPYGRIFETAREAIAADEEHRRVGGTRRRLENFALKHLLPHRRRTRAIGNLAWFAEITGLRSLALYTGLPAKIAPAFASLGACLPKTDPPWRRPRPGTVYPSKGPRKARVSFFLGCVMDAMMHRVNRLTIELLQEYGCEVVVPKKQVCCGALHAHQGHRSTAQILARQNLAAYESVDVDFHVNNAGGCGAMLKEISHLFPDDAAWRERAVHFQEKSRDVSEVLVEVGPPHLRGSFDGIVTYQDSCHLRHVQKVSEAPRNLIRHVAGERFREMRDAAGCCASAGIYNILHFGDAMAILDSKMIKAEETGANVIVTSNPGCHLQMLLGVQRAGLEHRVRVLHLVEFLAEYTVT